MPQVWFQPAPKYGHSRSKQTGHCGQRRYYSVPETERPRQPEQLKAQAAALYAEGGMAASSRPLGIPEIRKEPAISGLKKSVRPGSC